MKNYILTKEEKTLLNYSAKSLINLTSHSINLKKCLYKLNLKKEICSILEAAQTIVVSIQGDVITSTSNELNPVDPVRCRITKIRKMAVS